MNIIEKLTALLSLLLLIACMLAPLKRTAWIRRHPGMKQVIGFHTAYGIILLFTGLIHGPFCLEVRSPGRGTAMMTGKLAWMLLLVLTLLSPLKKRMKQNTWRYLHLTLAAAGCILVAIHILQALIF